MEIGIQHQLSCKALDLNLALMKVFHSSVVLRKTSKQATSETPRADHHHGLDVSLGNSPVLSSSPLNTPLNRTPVRKISRQSSADSHRNKDGGSGGSNASSGSSTPVLPYRDLDMLQSISDTESVASSHGPSKNNNNNALPELDFLPEVIEGYDEMEEDVNRAKEMLHHLQNLVSCFLNSYPLTTCAVC